MAQTRLRKVDVARGLLDRAIDLYLDEKAYVPAIVMAGAAEDVFHGYLKRNNLQPTRANVAVTAARLYAKRQQPAPNQQQLERHFVNRMRDLFNWLRHADDATEPDEDDFDLEEEAMRVIDRAMTDMGQLLGDYPARTDEFDKATRHLR
jgi:hypothetical protein